MLKSAYYRAGAALARIEQFRPLGRNIFSEDWDICIVLDSTRLDAFRSAVADRSQFPSCGEAWSVGSITTEWLTNTFREPYADEIADTTLVTATPHSQTVFSDREWLTNAEAVSVDYPDNPAVSLEDFNAAHELWRTHATDHDVVPPETMRSATIEAWKSTDRDRVVAHWMQPHEPFIASEAPIVGGNATEKNVWDELNAGELDETDVWDSYTATLEYALEEVATLLESVDATVLITSDHGNAFGEWGIYGHPFGWPHPSVRKVPWCIVEASAEQPAETDGILSESETEITADLEDQLKALGYR